MAERLNFCLIDFRIFNSPEQLWHRPRCSSQASESAASNSPSKNALRTSSQSEQAPVVLMLDSDAGGGIMAMSTISLREYQLASLTITLPFMFGWIEHK